MKSGAVLALSRLLYEFNEELPVDFVLALVQTVVLLLQEKVRVCVSAECGGGMCECVGVVEYVLCVCCGQSASSMREGIFI